MPTVSSCDLERGVDLLVATCGRLVDMVERSSRVNIVANSALTRVNPCTFCSFNILYLPY